MAERRPLISGLTPQRIDPEAEKAFVFAGKEPKKHELPAAKDERHTLGRAPLTTRIRADYAIALKKASLQRQLDGVHPNTLQEILEEALQPWLSKNGYLS